MPKHIVTVKNPRVNELRTDGFATIAEMHMHIRLCKSQGWKIVSIKRATARARVVLA